MKAIVVGGGLAGISAALTLVERGHQVTLLEQEPQLGGKARTQVDGERLLELGPNSFAGRHQEVWRLLERLQLEPLRLGAQTRVRYLVQGGRLRALTPHPLSILRVLPLRAVPRILRELRVRPGAGEESVYDFVARRFGALAANALASALVTGVYAGDPRTLSLQACFPALAQWEHDYGSILRALPRAKPSRAGIFTVRGGLGAIGVRAQEVLGDRARCGVNGTKIATGEVHLRDQVMRADAVIVATSARAAALLCSDSALAMALAAFTYAPLTVVHWRGEARLPHGFGYIAPESEKLFALGTIFASDLLGESERRFASLVGGTLHPERAALNDDELVHGIDSDLRKLTGGRISDVLRVKRWTQGVVQPFIGHKQRVARAHAAAARAGLVLAGAYLGSGAMHDAVATGHAAAARFAQAEANAYAS